MTGTDLEAWLCFYLWGKIAVLSDFLFTYTAHLSIYTCYSESVEEVQAVLIEKKFIPLYIKFPAMYPELKCVVKYDVLLKM